MLKKVRQARARRREARLERKTEQVLDRLWEAQGERLLLEQKRLKEGPDFLLPDGFEERVLEGFRAKLVRNAPPTPKAPISLPAMRRRPLRTRTVLKKAWMVALLAVLVAGSLSLGSGAIRQWLARLVTRDIGVAAQISLQGIQTSDHSASDTPHGVWLPTWVPEGYEMVILSPWGQDGLLAVEYQNADEQPITYQQADPTAVPHLDTRDAEVVENRQIDGWAGLFILRGTRGTLFWFDEAKGMYLSITMYEYDADTMDRIVDSITLAALPETDTP